MLKLYRKRRKVIDAMMKIDQNKRETIKLLQEELRGKYDEIFRADLGGKLRAEAVESLKPSRDFLHYLKQEQMREDLLQAGITVPEEYGAKYNDDVLLSQKGEKWAHIQLRKYRDQRVEFWAKLIMPALSLIVSIVALIFSIRRH